MRIGQTVVVLALTLGSLCSQVFTTPPPGDPDVFLAFFRMYDRATSPSGGAEASLGTVTRGSSTPVSPAAASASASAWQRRLGLSDADFSILNRSSAILRAQTAQTRAEAAAYVNSVAAEKRVPDEARLQTFRAGEIAVSRRAMASLKAQLSPSGSRALFQFIDGEFRVSAHRATIGGR